MKYMGSKARLAKYIIPIMVTEANKNNINEWVEPFVGGANLIDKVPKNFKRVGYDINPYIIEMFNKLKSGWDPKINYTKDEYNYIKENMDQNKYLTGYVAINCSYSGKWFGGYAGITKTKNGIRDYQAEAYKNVMAQVENLRDVDLYCSSYDLIQIKNKSVIYCDPPYKNTTKYKDSFNHDLFYEWCLQKHSEGHLVFISEYSMPEDLFEVVWYKDVKSSLSANGSIGGSKNSTEKLFVVR